MDIKDITRLCPRCMKLREERSRVCQWCGFNESTYEPSPEYLLPGTILKGVYYVGIVLGKGGFANTYIAYHLNLERVCAIKEFYVRSQGMYRNSESSPVISYSKDHAEQEKMIRHNFLKFEQEAYILAGLGNMKGIVTVFSFFYENNTCYMEEEYIRGERLSDYVTRQGPLSFPQIVEKMGPMMESIRLLHEKGFFHMDISPDNIMIHYGNENQKSFEHSELILIDFGAARRAGARNDRIILRKKGYSSLEQTIGIQEPSAAMDVYSLAATIYYSITGQVPADAAERERRPDSLRLPGRMGIPVTPMQENVLLKGMGLRSYDRYADMKEFLDALRKSTESAHHSDNKKMAMLF